MKKLIPPIPPQYEQPTNTKENRILGEGDFELNNYVPDTHYRIWYNNQYEGYSSHHHDAMEIILVQEDNYDVIADGNKFHLTQGDVLIIPPNMLHEICYSETGTRFICMIDISILAYFRGFSSLKPILLSPYYCSAATKPAIYQEVYKLLNHAIHLYFKNEVMVEMEIYSLLFQMFAIITQDFYKPKESEQTQEGNTTSREHYERILALLNYIEENFGEEITLEKAADLTGFSKFHFTRLFKEQTSSTFYDYLIKRRIHEAQRLLYTNTSITDIAFQTGFNNSTTFCRSFKKVTGMSPSEYRNKFRNEPDEIKKTKERWQKIEAIRQKQLQEF